ncbi:hypothetical protein DENIS_1301 [Desulfonema ishimotonii]|uniref:Uncharacterized protein n=1 Tax=Desulfonema ishimotonii TaxID=45657 RepID=A0A401FTR4_9BACT|nr:hypothetical protein DENIS_1301 [Desulfonema ishimotonii]
MSGMEGKSSEDGQKFLKLRYIFRFSENRYRVHWNIMKIIPFCPYAKKQTGHYGAGLHQYPEKLSGLVDKD